MDSASAQENRPVGRTSSPFTHSDIFRLRATLIEIVEELKLRQSVEKENEEKIKQLMLEKHDLERNLESAKCARLTAEESHQQELTRAQQHFEDKLRNLEEEQKQFHVLKTCAEKEMKALKDESRTLQLAKYGLEKRVKELEAKLSTQQQSSDTQLRQLSGLEHKLDAMKTHVRRLEGSQSRLDKNVEEASKLNTSLMHANRHQQCVIDQLRKDTDKLRSQLVKARAALQREPPDTIRLTEQQEEIHRLKLRLETMEARNKTTEREFQTCETSYQMCMKNLKNAQALINRHLTDREKYEGKIELLEAREQDLKRQCETLNTQLETAYSELEELGKRHDDDVKRWTEKVDRANTEIADLKEELSATTSVLKSKEDQNHSLSDQLQHTADQLSKAQEKLNVARADDVTQTLSSFFSTSEVGSQAETDKTDSSNQTYISVTCTSSQTLLDVTHTPSQTDILQTTTHACQTYVAPLFGQSSQTDAVKFSIVATQTDEVREVKIPDMMGNTASKRACSGDHSASGIATEENENHPCDAHINKVSGNNGGIDTAVGRSDLVQCTSGQAPSSAQSRALEGHAPTGECSDSPTSYCKPDSLSACQSQYASGVVFTTDIILSPTESLCEESGITQDFEDSELTVRPSPQSPQHSQKPESNGRYVLETLTFSQPDMPEIPSTTTATVQRRSRSTPQTISTPEGSITQNSGTNGKLPTVSLECEAQMAITDVVEKVRSSKAFRSISSGSALSTQMMRPLGTVPSVQAAEPEAVPSSLPEAVPCSQPEAKRTTAQVVQVDMKVSSLYSFTASYASRTVQQNDGASVQITQESVKTASKTAYKRTQIETKCVSPLSGQKSQESPQSASKSEHRQNHIEAKSSYANLDASVSDTSVQPTECGDGQDPRSRKTQTTSQNKSLAQPQVRRQTGLSLSRSQKNQVRAVPSLQAEQKASQNSSFSSSGGLRGFSQSALFQSSFGRLVTSQSSAPSQGNASPQDRPKLSKPSASISKDSPRSLGLPFTTIGGRGNKTACAVAEVSPVRTSNTRGLQQSSKTDKQGSKSRTSPQTTSKYPMLQIQLTDCLEQKRSQNQKGILRAGKEQITTGKSVTFAATLNQTREIPPRRPPQTRSAPSLPSVTDGDAPLFDDADVHDEVKEDEAKKKIDKQCARIVGMLEEHVSSRPSAKTGRKRKLED